jgi:hypothetical protein
MRATCRRLKAEHGLDLVVIDYVQLIKPTPDVKDANRNEQVTDISRRLKLLADELDVSVLLVSQLSRANEKRADPRPRLSDLRESGALEQDSDTVFFLHRENHRAGGATEGIFEKQRNGPTGTVLLDMDRDTNTFRDADQETVPETPDFDDDEPLDFGAPTSASPGNSLFGAGLAGAAIGGVLADVAVTSAGVGLSGELLTDAALAGAIFIGGLGAYAATRPDEAGEAARFVGGAVSDTTSAYAELAALNAELALLEQPRAKRGNRVQVVPARLHRHVHSHRQTKPIKLN